METVVRVVIIYVIIVAGLRVLGKREFGQLSPLELVTLLLIPEIVAQALIRENYSLTNGIIGLTTLFALVFFTSLVMHMSERAETVISGEPTVLAAHGKFLTDNMNRERISPEEIYAELHKSGLYTLGQVRWVILETDGKIAVVARDEPDNVTRPHEHDEAIS